MAKAINNQEKKLYEVLKECWINGYLYKPNQSIQLTHRDAKEWLDRKYIKLVKKTTQTTQVQSNKPVTAGGQSVAGGQEVEEK